MLPTKRRVKKEFFVKIMKNGLFLHENSFYLSFLNRKDALPSTFSFIVPSKVEKTSVGRHRTKRQMSAVIEGRINDIDPGFSSLFFCKKKGTSLSPASFRKEILDLCKKAGMLKD